MLNHLLTILANLCLFAIKTNMAIIAKIIFRTGLLFGFGLGIVCKGITPKFFRSGNLFMKAKDLSRSSSFSASCCISW